MDSRNLTPGAFYWVVPAFDVDLVPPGFKGKECDEAMHEALREHWINKKPQPARFVGYHDGSHCWERWEFIGQHRRISWSPIWIGDEIKAPSS